jgi:hypothetical protein
MKNTTRNRFPAEKSRRVPLFLFIMGLCLRIGGNWLPTRVICFKADEKPKIEFSFNGCECSHNDGHAAPDVFPENESAKLQPGRCLDVPLEPELLPGATFRSAAVHGALSLRSRPEYVLCLLHFLPWMEAGIKHPPPGQEMTGHSLACLPRAPESHSLLCRLRC